jgi:hypothetical protein
MKYEKWNVKFWEGCCSCAVAPLLGLVGLLGRGRTAEERKSHSTPPAAGAAAPAAPGAAAEEEHDAACSKCDGGGVVVRERVDCDGWRLSP